MNKQATPSFLPMLVIILALQVAHSEFAYEQAPPVNVSVLTTFYKSAVDSKVIGSRLIQNLQLTHTTNGSGAITQFKLTFLNRTTPLNFSEANYARQGSWQYLLGTKDSLSCNVVYEPSLKLYGLLRFVGDAAPGDQLKMVEPVPWQTIRSFMAAMNRTITQDEVPSILQVGDDCRVGLVGNVIFRIINNFSGVKIINLPVGTSIQAKTESFDYGIVGSQLYRYNEDTLQYKPIYTFPVFQNFMIKQMQGRIIAYGSNATENNTLGMRYKVNQVFYIFDDKYTGFTRNFTLIKTLEYNGFSFDTFFKMEYSPQLSKFGFGYTPLNATNSSQTVITAKSVDYLNNKVVDLEFVDLNAYLLLASQSNGLFDFNDNFLVIRSAMLKREAAYQFVGNKIASFAERDLTGDADLNTCVRVLVDPYFKSSLVALAVHQIPDGYLIKQVRYGSYAASHRIAQPAPQSFIKFQIPPGQMILGGPEWTWFASDGTDTKIQIFRLNENVNGSYQRITNTINFDQTLLASSPNCAIAYEAGASKYAVIRKEPSSGIFTRTDITTSLAAVQSSSKFLISERCDRIAVDRSIYYQSSAAGQFTKTANADQNFTWNQIDKNLTYAVGLDVIFGYNFTTKFFDLIYKRPLNYTYFPNTVVESLNNRLVVYTMSEQKGACPCQGVSLEYSAFISKEGKLSLVGEGAMMWDDVPKISLSSGLTKAVAQGWINKIYEVKAVHFDYSSLKNVTIIMPVEDTARAKDYMLFQAYDEFIYIRQLPDPAQSANSTYTSVSNKQFIYFLSQDYLPRLIFQRKLSIPSQAAWERTFIVSGNNHSALFTESRVTENSKNYVVVDKNEIDPKQASVTEGSTGGMGAFIKDGKVIVCPPGCTECTTGVCTECNTGFAFDANTGTCLRCSNGCTACNSADPTKCTDCYNGFILAENTCSRCDPKCISCSGTPSTCLQCQHGEYYSAGNTCQKCPANCDSCSDDGTLKCDVCRKGFTKTNDGRCRGCSISCSSCKPDDITACTSCAIGLQLVNSACVPCPDKCHTCNGNSCLQCAPGYSSNSIGQCVLNCLMPCASCIDNQPSICTSCFGSSILTGGKCNIDTNCNSTGSCSNCGVGLNYFLFQSKCYPCSTIANIDGCIQCSQANQQLCSLCNGGYFLTIEGTCSKCPDTCMTCLGQGICTSCQLGFTLPQSMTQGPCLQCLSPCLTCAGTPNYCTSCMAGYTKRGWKCQNDNYVGFTLEFPNLYTSTSILAIIDDIVNAILTAAGQTNLEEKKDQVTIFTIKDGSVSASGSFTPATGSVGSAAASISTGITGLGSIAGVPVTPITFSVYSSQSEKEDKKGLIIGVVIGTLVFIVLAVVVFVCYYRYRKNQLGMRVLEANSSIIQSDIIPNEAAHPQVQKATINKHVQIIDLEVPSKPSDAEFVLEKELELS